MALSVGQRQVRIEADIVQIALHDQPRGDFINLDEKIVGASVELKPAGPHTIVFIVEKVSEEEA